MTTGGSDVTLASIPKKHVHPSRPHKPVPATEVFARKSPRLHLPKLDAFLATLEPPSFLEPGSKWPKDQMFIPMDKLGKDGRTLDDLELNSEVPPFWRNRATLLGSAVNTVLGFTGSSALAAFYSIQGLANTVQVFALLVTTILPFLTDDLMDNWHQLLLGTVPQVLALNFADSVTRSLVLLSVFLAISSALLWYFWRWTREIDRYNRIEGLQQNGLEGKQWGLIVVTFALTVLYLPLSTMAVHALVWSDDLWVVTNPYTNATTSPPELPSLGPADEYRQPLDFCWTTTMKKNEINFAPVIFILALTVLITLTIWFPLALRRVIRQSVPQVDKYSGLGRKRSRADLDSEYSRLLERDKNPFTFLYNGYRRGMATYQSTYLFAKLSTLVLIALIDADNCLFRTLPRNPIPIVRQVCLLVSTLGFFGAHCYWTPFLDPVNNASEWVSRLNYVLTSIVALLLALNVPGNEIYNVYVLYVIYVVTYGAAIYFMLVNLGPVKRVLKRWTKRIDFSVDIFSPALDLSFPSVHTLRRIWQESVTTLLLTNKECAVPERQKIVFAQARDSEYPPYLLDFKGTPAERHIENLKILREIGSHSYNRASALLSGPDREWFKNLEMEIQTKYIGPDSYWRDDQDVDKSRTSFFGNAWWISFPPTLVMKYDDGKFAVLQGVIDLERYISLNESPEICRKRQVRMSLRALEGQTVRWPYDHVKNVGTSFPFFNQRSYKARNSVHFETCKFEINRNGRLEWDGVQFGSGFQIRLNYAKKVDLDGDAIGITADWELTSLLARFLEHNRELINSRIGGVEKALHGYREHHRKESKLKVDVLTYQFLSHVYIHPQQPKQVTERLLELESDIRVRALVAASRDAFEAAYERFEAVSRSETATWWYIFWDDLWRRNHDTIKALETHAADFNPWYPTSIAYTPLPRPALEAFLSQRGLMSKMPKKMDVLHVGFLNKLYLRLNETVFRGSNKAIMFHIGGDIDKELDMEDIDAETLVQPSTLMGTLGTGGGTDHDDANIRPRPEYKWEGLLSDPVQTGRLKRHKRFTAKLGAWLGVTPLWRTGTVSQGLALDVRMENGRYVLTDGGSSIASGSYMDRDSLRKPAS
ncbi:hypothetical protein CYLTODRAFT_357890 [Cylindrobasidium torrendii FP15055 ss-10]|uniref:Uncharacterized protein n=1 Tax=Cylindrobasidium torrendii FP15055 ss-10 TaxID=1314674 RepID=A0A0D7B5M5_9AGAR|nr:hypothetical protein CYLTODRAFT_357890 [Cylindrobasidium torrendii FP15055 ss-10]